MDMLCLRPPPLMIGAVMVSHYVMRYPLHNSPHYEKNKQDSVRFDFLEDSHHPTAFDQSQCQCKLELRYMCGRSYPIICDCQESVISQNESRSMTAFTDDAKA